MTIRCVTPDDLDGVTALEAAAFPPEEAASRESFAYRIQTFPERFFVAEEEGRIVGLINGCASRLDAIRDELFGLEGHEADGPNQMIFGLATAPDRRGQGIAAALMNHMIEFCCQSGMNKVILTCKRELIPFYQRFGYVNQGISASVHGGAVWYDMTLCLSPKKGI